MLRRKRKGRKEVRVGKREGGGRESTHHAVEMLASGMWKVLIFCHPHFKQSSLSAQRRSVTSELGGEREGMCINLASHRY